MVVPCPLYSCASLRSLAASNKSFLLLIFGLVVSFGSISFKKLKWSRTLCSPPREKSFSYPSFLFVGNRVHSASLTFPEFQTARSNCCCCSVSHVWPFVTPWTAAHQASLSFISWSLLKLMSTESVMSSNYLILYYPLLLLPSIFPSISFSISHSNEYLGLISFRFDWFDLLAVQGMLKNLLQHHSLKTSIFQHSAFFMVWLSNLYMTTGKTIALTIWTFASKVISLLFHTLSWFAIAFLPRSKNLLISWLQSQSTVIWGPKKMNLILFPYFPHQFAMKW